jgi:hypothetical protein
MNAADELKKQLEAAHQNGADEMEVRSLMQRHVAALMFQHVFSGVHIPREIAIMLGSAFSFLATGSKSSICQPSKLNNSKRARRSPWESMCIAGAVHYLRAVESGVINDLTPVKTVQKAFGGNNSMNGGLSKRAIQTWRDETLPIEFEAVGSDPEKITHEMEVSGAMYSDCFSLQAKAGYST